MPREKRKRGKARHPKAAADVGKTLRDHPLAENWSARPGRFTAAGEKARALGAGMERRLRGLLRDDRMRRRVDGK